MEEEIKQIKEQATVALEHAADLAQMEAWRVEYLGRKGAVAGLFSRLGDVPAEQKPLVGRLLNDLKSALSQAYDARQKALSTVKKTAVEFDLTLPGTAETSGNLHPLTLVIREICDIFVSLGFSVMEGPEIETEFYNFEALNIPLDHPSRDAFDTYYLKSTQSIDHLSTALAAGSSETKINSHRLSTIDHRLLLRSHTSPVQIRAMQKQKPPLAIVIPGRVYRPDAVDASHSFMFHQVEGLLVDEGVKFSDLKGVLTVFARRLFGPDTRMRFRPHFFPFTEPSAEVDISCIICKGRGCRVCSQKGWLEVLGAGMVNPRVFAHVGYNPDKTYGFAFGMGVERIAMLKFGIDDIRLFFDNDLRFLNQF